MTDILFSSWGGVVTDNRGKPEAERQAVVFWLSLPQRIRTRRKRSRPLRAGMGLPSGTRRSVFLISPGLLWKLGYEKESCGKCTPCRVGTRVMATLMNRIADGQGRRKISRN